MDFGLELLDFIRLNTSSEVSIEGSKIHIPDHGISFTLKYLNRPNQDGRTDHKIIWEDQWVQKPAVVKSRVLSALGLSQRIYARDTALSKITQVEAGQFLEENHMIGATKAKTKLGLFHKDELVSVATFSSPTKMERNGIIHRSFEMIRYCSLAGHSITGGLSKLLKHFIDIQQPDDVMTYVDREWSNGSSFEKLGFKKVEETPPKEFWIDENEMVRYPQLPPDADYRQFKKIQNQGNHKFILFLK